MQRLEGDAMTFRMYEVATAVICLAFGAAFMLVPQLMGQLYGVPYTTEVAMLARFFGSAMFGIGTIAWVLKDISDSALVPKLLVAQGIQAAIGCLVAIHATTTHAINPFGWVSVFIYGALGVASVVLYRNASGATFRTV